MLSSLKFLFGGVFLGWSLGSNDAANVFGTAVSSRMVSYKVAIWLTALFVILGALLQGQEGIITLSEKLKKKHDVTIISESTEATSNAAMKIAMIASFSAAFTVTIMTILKIPVSTSQAVVGAIIGIGMMENNVNLQGLTKVIACWIGTPIGSAILTLIF